MTANNLISLVREDSVMKRFSIVLIGLLALTACNEAGPDIDRVQTSLVDKSVFQGEWWYTQATVDVDGDEASVAGGFVWEGGNAYVDLGRLDTFAIPRIRWVIDEDYLFAYRSYELIAGANEDGRNEDYRGEPLAVFKISRHVDVRYDYDPVTGERSNVKVENSSDRRWYEREFMYVDWSQNLVSSYYGVVMTIDALSLESAPFFFEAGAHEDFPKAWEPSFVTVAADEGYRFRDEWPAEDQDTVHYMSVVTQYIATPGASCLYYGGGPCQSTSTTVRHSFLRIPPQHEYATATQTHQEFDRFGLFRAEGRTFIRGNVSNDDLRRRCNVDADCGTGGTCGADNICRGGLARSYGETDFLDFFRPRYNIWTDHLTDTQCLSDWECSSTPGSQCDRVARRCTVPIPERPTRQVVYHLNQGYPKHLIRPALETVWNWNEVFMAGHRAARGEGLPTGDRVACQSDDPIGYCHCDSPEAMGGTCAYKRDPYIAKAEAEAAGAVNAYDCHIQMAAPEPAHPTSHDDYPAEIYDFEFVGSECAFVLKPNSCDVDPEAACEQQGDLRYQFFNYIQHGQVRFGGVAEPLMDPTTGELITSDANMAAESAEYYASTAVRLFPALRCSGPAGCAPGEEGADVMYTEGETIRRYFSRAGQTWHPQAFAESGTDGTTIPDDGPRPALPVEGLHAAILADLESRLPRGIENLHGVEGRAQIFSSRIQDLAGTPIESRLLQSLGAGGMEALAATQDRLRTRPDALITDPDMMDQLSPMRGATMLDLAPADYRLWQKLGRDNMDPPAEVRSLSQRSSYLQYWAEAFRGVPAGEAAIRMQQLYVRGVMHHELGHCVGERHNYASSFDRDNYYDGALNVMFELPLPKMEEFDNPARGGDGSGFLSGVEMNNYYAELRRVRDERSARGMHNFTSGSVMEYAGDLSDFNNDLGRYDKAVVWWNQWDLVEGYVGDPLHVSTDTLNGILKSHEYDRTLFRSYRGGESCNVDTECPFATGSALMAGQPITQRCIQNPRDSRLPVPCDGADRCVCSAFDEDFNDYVEGAAYERDADGDGEIDYVPVRYLFCGDERGNDISWCSAFDAGESFQEVVDHYRRAWVENYPRSYYRQFRRSGPATGASFGFIVQAVKIYQHLFFRYFYEPGFRSDPGPLGIDDQWFASIDTMNWLGEMMNLPDVGSYELDPAANIYRRVGDEMGAGDIDLEHGVGFPMWSQNQEGYSGFFRLERGGVFWDKFIAIYALANRDWGLSFTVDERFYINFYDLWDTEMMELFGGLIIDEPSWYAPRVVMEGGAPQIQHLTWARGPCRGSQPEVYTSPALGGTSNEILRDWAAVLALAQFPVYYDTTFEQRAIIFKQDSGEGWTIPDRQPDGSATCAYGPYAVATTHTTGCAPEDADYVVYESERFHTPYLAVKVRSRIEYNLEEEQLGFQLLRRLVDLQTEVQALRALPSPTPAQLAELREKEDKLVSNESFLEYLIDLQRRYGISGLF